MDVRRMFVVGAVVGVAMVAAGNTGAAAAGPKKVKRQPAPVAGAAGAVSSARATTFKPRAIDNNDGQGYYCTFSTPNVHYLGTLPPGTGVRIDFENDGTSDPIAVLTTIKMDGTDVGAENGASDDDGGELNPRFELRRPYMATYILTVSTADDEEACYAYRMRVVQ